MGKKRALAALLALCLALVLPGCQGQEEQDAYYASLMAQRAEQLPEEPEPGTWRYLNMEPEPGDTLQGEVVIRGSGREATPCWRTCPRNLCSSTRR